MPLVKCLYCGEQFDRNKEEWVKPTTNRYAHKKCYENKDALIQEKEDFFATAKKILGTTYNYNKIKNQSSKFLQEGKTYKELSQTLDYFYNIKGNDAQKACGGIGIIPHVYEEAMTYFQEKDKKANRKIEKDTSEPNIKKVIIKRHGFQKMADINYFHLE